MSNFINLFPIGTYFGEGAEISAYDPASQRLFVISGDTTLQILDISDPTRPQSVATLDVATFGVGGANSVAIKNGLVAIATQAEEKTDLGQVLFFDVDGTLLNQVTVGALPDMITFTPDGTRVVVANEGEPNDDYTVDPEGSISIVDLSNGVTNATVATAGFTAFNGRLDELKAEGVRIFGPNATVAQDLEPEYITVSADSTTAWVTLQENNAIARIDLTSATVQDVSPLGYKDHSTGQPTLTTYEFTNRPTLGRTAPSDAFPKGQKIQLGGFSGLFFEGYDRKGNLIFVTHPDRGPNGEPTDLFPGNPGNERPFPLPDFQPEIVRFRLNPNNGRIKIQDRIKLTDQSGDPLTGLPNLQAGLPGSAYTDEFPVDLFGNPLPNDPLGADLEGIVVAEDGTFWMVDEYRPAIYHFSAKGQLIDRFIPEGTAAAVGQAVGTFGTESLPAVYAQRRANRGFEAVALEGNKLYAFIQSPIDNPDTTGDTVSRASSTIRIVELDITTGEVTGEYLYVFKDVSGSGTAKTDKIGDAVSLGNGKFLVAERDDRTGTDSNKLIFEIDLKQATNVHDPANVIGVPAGKTLEQLTYAELIAAGVDPVSKRLVTNLGPVGYTGVSKLEGLARIDEDTIAVINDNDFGLQPQPLAGDGTVPLNPNPEPILLGIVDFNRGNGLDASDEDGAINITNHPVFGMYQPDAIASYVVNGQTYLITANEGDARDYDGFAEEERIEDLTLDPTVFPNAAELQQEQNLGRLTVTAANGDVDGDGDYDQLYAFGARSFSIWDGQGNLVYDSGDQLEQITAALFPALFNSQNGDLDSFDSRSDNKGPEPEGVTVAVIDGRTYGFIGLERIGGVLVFDISNPMAPTFVQYANYNASFGFEPGQDAAPEGLTYISADNSPNGKPLLVVTNEVSGTTTLYEMGTPTQGTEADDALEGTSGDDFLYGLGGNDAIDAKNGTDRVLAGDGNDAVQGRSGDDIIYGGLGSDALRAAGGNDRLYGEAGDDKLVAGDGDDLLWGGSGNNQLRGGQGSDTFVLQAGDGSDVIEDFVVGQDFLALAGELTFADLSISQMQNNTVIRVGDDVLATLRGVQFTSITEANFTVL